MTVQLENASATNTCFFVFLLFFFSSNCIWLVNVKVMLSFFMKDGLTALCSTYTMANFMLLIQIKPIDHKINFSNYLHFYHLAH